MPRIFTWNCNGNFTVGQKKTTVDDLIRTHQCELGMIQEGGIVADGLYGLFRVYGGVAVGAKNRRCTNYIVVASNIGGLPAPEPIGLNAVGGGEAGRTAAAAAVELSDRTNILACSWHSLSGPASSNQDTSALIKELKAKGSNTIIGGDFNALQFEIDNVIIGQMNDRKAAVRASTLGSPAGAPYTYPKKLKDLDYFVIIGEMATNTFPLATVLPVTTSDHNPVIFTL